MENRNSQLAQPENVGHAVDCCVVITTGGVGGGAFLLRRERGLDHGLTADCSGGERKRVRARERQREGGEINENREKKKTKTQTGATQWQHPFEASGFAGLHL